jgi:glycosyltransferase involved in cell wall biosynthesis
MLETGHAPHRPGSRRILFVTPSSPYPANSGGAQRTALLHAALSKHAEVDLFLLGSPTPDVQAVLTESFRLVGTFKNSRIAGRILRRGITLLSPELDSCLPDRSKAAALSALLCENDYDAVVVRYSATACMLSGVGRCPKTLLIVDVDDLVADLTATGALPGHSAWRGFPRRFLNRLTRRWIEPYERRNLLRCDGLWLNGRTPAWLAGGDRRRVVRLPNIPYNRAESHVAEGEAGARTVDFIGVAQFRYGPNEEGFDWFLRRVWPRITAKRPGARIRLAGLRPKPATLKRWTAIPGVELMGAVEDLQGLYATSKVAVAPIHRGAGTKIKVLEALAMGLPCVCSPHAAIELGSAEGLIVADDDEAFANSCLDLLENDARRRELASRGRRSMDQHFSSASFDARVEELLEYLLSLPPVDRDYSLA